MAEIIETIFQFYLREKKAKIFETLGYKVEFIEKLDKDLDPTGDIGLYNLTVKDVPDLIGKLIDIIGEK